MSGGGVVQGSHYALVDFVRKNVARNAPGVRRHHGQFVPTEPFRMNDMRVLIIGGGLVGLGTARALQQLDRGIHVTICDKEPRIGAHQSTHNSGVLHAGLHYKPGSLKAKLAVRGIRMMTAFAREHGVAHDVCGKIAVATNAAEEARLRDLHARGTANGLRDLRWLTPDEIREREPNVRGVAALHVPEEGIIDYAGVVEAERRLIERDGGEIVVNAGVRAARSEKNEWIVETTAGAQRADFVITCAGLQADRVARLFGERPTTRVLPFRGDYCELARPELVRHLVYPVPDPAFPFLGVHYTRMIHGGVECGPTAVLALHREGYHRTALSARDTIDTLTFRGFWQFVARYPRPTWNEWRRAFDRHAFLRTLQRMVPSVTLEDLRPGQTGVRAQAMRPDGSLVEDFEFLAGPRTLHVINAPSPAATASLAIGETIAGRVVGMI